MTDLPVVVRADIGDYRPAGWAGSVGSVLEVLGLTAAIVGGVGLLVDRDEPESWLVLVTLGGLGALGVGALVRLLDLPVLQEDAVTTFEVAAPSPAPTVQSPQI